MRDPPWMVAPALGEGLRSQPPRRHLGCPPSTEAGDDRHPPPSSSSCPCHQGLSRASRAVYGPRTGVEQGSGNVNTVELTQRRGRSAWGGSEGLPHTSLGRVSTLTPPCPGTRAQPPHRGPALVCSALQAGPWGASDPGRPPSLPPSTGGVHGLNTWMTATTLRALLRSLG